jgi:hypothetical protein
MDKQQFTDMSLAELTELVGEEIATAIVEQRHQTVTDTPEGEYSDIEWEELQKSRCYLDAAEVSFTDMAQDRDLMASLNEVETQTVRRWVEVEALRDHYALFEDFLFDCMTELMGFKCSDLQIDIGRFLQSDVQYGMIQAQRSQAKSTIVAMFAVWQLIHDCKHRILIISAGSEVAAEIANWVIQIIMNWDILECLRPDRTHGDRASSKSFDINWQLKGAEKSPSVACIGITANMQGRRADLLIPDDIESSKNGSTEVQRAALEHLSKDFTSICQKGRIMYLGTPQTVDSIYNNLTSRGYQIRVWTGRYPTVDELKFYEGRLAPFLQDLMDNDPTLQLGGGVDGSRGQPTDPVLLGEDLLCSKELDQGPAYFNLQHMLNTNLSDEMRHPLKTKNLIMMNFPIDKGPGEVQWMPAPLNKITVAIGSFTGKHEFYRPWSVSEKLYEYEGKHMYVDTAGGGKNGDETVAAVTYQLHGYVYLAEILRLKGGYSEENYDQLSALSFKHSVNIIHVEKNFGFGAFASNWRPNILNYYQTMGKTGCPAIEDVWESGQKELRIIDTLEPLMARHKFIVHEDIITYDVAASKPYPVDISESYKFFHQLSKISTEKGALIHDDSLDAVAGSVRYWVEQMALDQTKRMEHKETDENADFLNSWGAQIGPNYQNKGTLGLSTDRFNRVQNRRNGRR